MSNTELNSTALLACDLHKAPTGAVHEDFTDVTVGERYTDTFILRIAEYLVKSGWTKRQYSEWVIKDPAMRHPNRANYYCRECLHEVVRLTNYCPSCGRTMRRVLKGVNNEN